MRGTTLLPQDRFHSILIWSVFRKTVEKIQVSLKSDNNNDILHEDNIHFFYHILLNSLKVVFNKFFKKIVLFMR